MRRGTAIRLRIGKRRTEGRVRLVRRRTLSLGTEVIRTRGTNSAGGIGRLRGRLGRAGATLHTVESGTQGVSTTVGGVNLTAPGRLQQLLGSVSTGLGSNRVTQNSRR